LIAIGKNIAGLSSINLKKSVEFTSAKNIQHKLDNPIGAIGTI
jgi:hypothetical protein